MAWYVYLLSSITAAVALSFWGWIAISILKLQKDYLELRSRVGAQDGVLLERLDWIKNIDAKLDTVAEGVAHIVGRLE